MKIWQESPLEDMESIEIAFLSSFSHDVHLGFAESIDADVVPFRSTYSGFSEGTPLGDAIAGFRWPDYDIYVIEGSSPLYAAAARNLIDDSPIIYLGGDRGMFALHPDSGETSRNSWIDSLIERYGFSVAQTIARRTIDGAIVVSDFIATYTQKVAGSQTPIRIAHPYIESETYDELGNVDPALESNTAVTIGRAMEYKGIDQLVSAWPSVRERHPEAELQIVGPGGHPDAYEQVPGVTVRGFVDNLSDAFAPCSLFVQPSRGDAFPVSTLEAMRAGVPPLVTRLTGTKSEVVDISEDLVVESTDEGLAIGVSSYFDRSTEEHREFSVKARERGKQFNEVYRKQVFRKQFFELLSELNSN